MSSSEGMFASSDDYRSVDLPVLSSSGPYGSPYFEHSWMFTGYVPDVLVCMQYFRTTERAVADVV